MPKKNTAETSETPMVSLLDQLAMPVAGVPLKPVIDDDDPEPETIVNAPFIEPEPEPPAAEWAKPEAAGYSQYQDQPQPEPQTLTPDDIAIIGVNMFDGIQQFLLTLLSKTMMLTPEERELIGTLDLSEKTIYQAGSKEAIAMAKYRKHIEAVKKLPFNPGEKQRLTDAGIIYARTLDLKVTPFQGIMMAVSEVMMTRTSDIIMNSL